MNDLSAKPHRLPDCAKVAPLTADSLRFCLYRSDILVLQLAEDRRKDKTTGLFTLLLTPS